MPNVRTMSLALSFLGVILPYILIVALLSVIFGVFKSPWFKGLAGEMMVHLSLKIRLDKDQYHLLRDVTVVTDDGTTQIDHIVVSRYGVFVVETKNMKGWIFGGARQQTWTQTIYSYKNKFQNPLYQNYKHVETLKSALGLSDYQILSVVAFVGSATFKTAMPENVVYGHDLVKYIRSKTKPIIDGENAQRVLAQIESKRLMPSRETNKAHIDHVKDIVERKTGGDLCPKCGSPMVVREARKGAHAGKKFLGCSRFPKCKMTLPVPLETAHGPDEESDAPFTDSWGKRTL